MKTKNERREIKTKIYCKSIDCRSGIFFLLYYEHSSYDKIFVMPNNVNGATYEDVIRLIKELFNVAIIGDEHHQTSGNDQTVFVTPPEKQKYVIGKKIRKSEGFQIVVSKNFVIKNKEKFLNFLAKLVSEKIIENIHGSVSYDLGENHYLINLNFVINDDNIPYMQKICRNFNNINCIFKHGRKDSAILFCEVRTKLYPIDEKTDEFWDYTVDFLYDGGHQYPLPRVTVSINQAGNVLIHSCPEKTLVLTREIYAKNLEQGLDILRAEMKNLGLDIRIVEKRRVR